MRQSIPSLLLLFWVVEVVGIGAQDTEYKGLLKFSCLEKASLQVSAEAPLRDQFPSVELRLTDASGRSVGSGIHNRPIPNSRYGKVIELPEKHKLHSKVVAVEICDAESGRYILDVLERGTQWYRIGVSGEDGKYGNETRSFNVYPHGDRVCEYRFNLKMADGKVTIQWLDDENQPLDFLEKPKCKVIPRA